MDSISEHLDTIDNKRYPLEIILVGNKSDLEGRVNNDRIHKFAKSINAPYIEVSAKTPENINQIFFMPLKSLIIKAMNNEIDIQYSISKTIDLLEQNTSSNCCFN